MAAACLAGALALGTARAELPPGGRLQVVPQLGNAERVHALAFAPDGRTLLVSAGPLALLWDTETGFFVRTFSAGGERFSAVAISADGALGALGTSSGAVRLVRLVDGATLLDLTGAGGEVRSVAFAPDGRALASGTRGGQVRVWSLPNGRVATTLDTGDETTAVSFVAPDVVVGAGRRGGVTAWRGPRWGPVASEAGARSGVLTAMVAAGAVAVSADGRLVLGDGRPLATAREAWGNVQPDTGFFDDTGTVWSAATTRRGDRVLLGWSYLGDYTHNREIGGAEVWDLAAGKRTPIHDVSDDTAGPVAVSADGHVGAVVRAGLIELRDLRDGGLLRRLAGAGGWLREASFSADGRLALVVQGGEAYVWDLQHLTRLCAIAGRAGGVSGAALSRDGRFAAAANQHGAQLYALPACRPVATAPFIRHWEDGGEPAPRHLRLAGESRVHWTEFHGTAAGVAFNTKRHGVYYSYPETLPGDAHNTPTCLDLSADGRRVLLGTLDPFPRLYDAATGALVRTLDDHGPGVTAVAFAPDGRRALTGAADGKVRLFDLDTGGLAATFSGPAGAVRAVAFSPDGQRALTGGDDGAIRVWSLPAGRLEHTLLGHGGPVVALAQRPDRDLVLSASEDGTVRLWDLGTGAWVALVNAGPEWLAFMDDGVFDASRGGAGLGAVVDGLRAHSVEQLAVAKNRPDLLLERFGLGSPELIAHYRALHERRQRKAGLGAIDPAARLDVPTARIASVVQEGKTITLTVALADTAHDLVQVQIYANNVALLGPDGRRVSGRDVTLTERLELAVGDNVLEVSCRNAAGFESLRAQTRVTFRGSVTPDLYYVGFGVSHYQHPGLDLAYAHADALDLGAALAKLPGFGRVHVATFTDADATRDSLARARAALAGARVDDVVVLFVAGHGVHANDPGATFYYLTYEADLANLAATAARFEDIEALLYGVAARRRLLLIDACESGDLEEERVPGAAALAAARGVQARSLRGAVRSEAASATTRALRTDRERFIYQDLGRRAGAVVFASSRGDESSYESAQLGHGVFTFELLAALSGSAADRNGDGRTSTEELRRHVAAAVAERTQGLQHPTIDHDNLSQTLDFPVVRAANTGPPAPAAP